MNRIAAIFSFYLLTACAPMSHDDVTHALNAEQASYNEGLFGRFVGQSYWVRDGQVMPVCSVPSPREAQCGTRDGHFKVEALERLDQVDPSMRVIFDDGQKGFVTLPFVQAGTLFVDQDPGPDRRAFEAFLKDSNDRDKARARAAAQQAKRPGVSIGMTPAQVLASSWGKPDHINRTITAAGTTEQWAYGGLHNFLYFTDGVLTGIQN